MFRSRLSSILTRKTFQQKNSHLSSTALRSLYTSPTVEVPSGRRGYHTYPSATDKGQITIRTNPEATKIGKSALKSIDTSLPSTFSLSEEFPSVPPVRLITDTTEPPVKITQFDNNLKFITKDVPGLMASIAVLVRAGGVYEKQLGFESHNGITQLLEMTSFRSTESLDAIEVMEKFEALGAFVQAVSTHEYMLYFVDVLVDNLDPALELLAEVVKKPQFTEDELEETRQIVQFTAENMDAKIASRELAFLTGFQGSALGIPHQATVESAMKLTSKELQDYHKSILTGSNTFISIAGVEHEYVVQKVKDLFSDIPTGKALQQSENKFVGGMKIVPYAFKDEFVKVTVAYNSVNWSDKDLATVCVIQQLLGGGSSFSSGGPGKGMYTRLYREVLCEFGWAESVEGFVSIHEAGGILGIDGSCLPDHVGQMVAVILEQFAKLGLSLVDDVSLNRAKKMLKSQMMMQLESRLVIVEDLARQMAIYGKIDLASKMCDKVDAVTAEDVLRVGRKMILESRPSIVFTGEDVSAVPPEAAVFNFVEHCKSVVQQTMEGSTKA